MAKIDQYLPRCSRIRETFDSAICAKYAIISLVRLVKVGAVIESTKPHGKAILE